MPYELELALHRIAERAEKQLIAEAQQAENPKDRLGATKTPLAYVPPASLIWEAEAMRDGAEKYGPYNWRDKRVQAMIYAHAALRHIMRWIDGEDQDPESGVHPLGHAKACMGIILDAEETGNLEDDRPKPGRAADLLAERTRKENTHG